MTQHASTPVPAPLPADAPAQMEAATGRMVLDSQSLLRGHQAITIAHNGSFYRLQTTRQGKLILTK
ncbi:MAG: hemin uptake protein HemP [Burkholderiaceae bacterium]